MIGKLKGLVDDIDGDRVIIDVNGVGYEAHCSLRTLAALPAKGEPVEMHIDTHVRETEFRLFGFRSKNERDWFRLLQTVQGVGAKVALAVLGALGPNELANAIALKDIKAVTKAPGVGPKVAQRMIMELKDKVAKLVDSEAGGGASSKEAGQPPQGAAAFDAVSALTNLGYPANKASDAVALAAKEAGDNPPLQTLIRLALKILAG